ncbi:uncharacterized protein [Rutidosis leptorrhynchoides]|uniref:uncharacterized protein n=1 Tax=Rutidosis leptorrhynchoides TaxID=125765 RepID=UPI003A98E170
MQIPNVLQFTWSWSRLPSRRTEIELIELQKMLIDYSFIHSESDSWSCNLQPNGLFSVENLTHQIDGKLQCKQSGMNKTMSNKLLPQKICIFVWRVMLRRIPVRVELDKCGIDLDSLRCSVCNDNIETVEHILIDYAFAKDLWERVSRWWNSSIPIHSSLEERFKGIRGNVNPNLTNTSSVFRQAIEWVCGYVIWQNRNHVIIRKKKGNGPLALMEIQTRSFEWLSSRSKKVKIYWNQWLLNPSYFGDLGWHQRYFSSID